MTIEFLPVNPRQRDVSPLLVRSLTSCFSVEGSIAFWTLPIDALGGKLLNALRRADSTFCVDMQWPTDFKKLARYAKVIRENRESPALYICLRKSPARDRNDVVSLLHTKLLLFNMGNRQWEIWIGSHNFTGNALQGRNLEAGIRIVGQADEPQFGTLLNQVQTYLRYIRTLCLPFDPDQLTYYQTMRGEVDATALIAQLKAMINESNIIVRRVLSLQCELADRLANQTIILLGNLTEELAAIRFRNRGGSPVAVRVKDVNTGQVYTYKAYLRANDLINNEPSIDVSFNQRRWAVRQVRIKGEAIAPPILQQARNVDAQLIRSNSYYVNVEILEQESGHAYIDYYTYPETDTAKLWRTEYEDVTGQVQLDYTLSPDQLLKDNDTFVSQVPVERAEELASIRPSVWTEDFEDGLLEKRIIVFGRPK